MTDENTPIPDLDDEAEKHVKRARDRIQYHKAFIEALAFSTSLYLNRADQAIIRHEATLDRWIIGYGAGLVFISLEGFGFINSIGLTYRLITVFLTILALIAYGITKMVRKDALTLMNSKLGAMERNELVTLRKLKSLEAGLKLNSHHGQDKRLEYILGLEKEIDQAMASFADDEQQQPDELSGYVQFIERGTDRWAVIALGFATIVLIIGAIVHLSA